MKIEKTIGSTGITLTRTTGTQQVFFETQIERDIVFTYWKKALEELEKSKAIFRPVYEDKDGNINILKLRYTTMQEVLEVDKGHKEHYPNSESKLVMIYNEQERSFQNVNF
jgi:hypothetical protein